MVRPLLALQALAVGGVFETLEVLCARHFAVIARRPRTRRAARKLQLGQRLRWKNPKRLHSLSK